MNHHLNVFRYFNEDQNSEFIENNLSRAFAICLKHDSLFFSKYVREILSDEDYKYLFDFYEIDSEYEINLQVNTNSLELSGFRKVYAVAMTAHLELNMDGFLNIVASVHKETNLTDLIIIVKDIAIVIEVKRYAEDCRQQLYDQVVPFFKSNIDVEVFARDFSWQKTLVLMEQVVNISRMQHGRKGFVDDFIELAGWGYPHWFSSRPFQQLPGLSDQSPKSNHARNLRLRQVIGGSAHEVLGYSDRMAIGVNFKWANEIIPFFVHKNGVDYITFMIWPGNTKGQGHHFYGRTLDWIHKKHLQVGDSMYDIHVEHHLKFCHFNRFITGLDFTDEVLKKPINTKENFHNKSGKWPRERWGAFEDFMDEHFLQDFDWRAKCGFDHHFIKSQRIYFTFSLGFMVQLYIPYRLFQQVDLDIYNLDAPANIINEIVIAYKALMN